MTGYTVAVVWNVHADAETDVAGEWSVSSSDGQLVTSYHLEAESAVEALEAALALIQARRGKGSEAIGIAVEPTSPQPCFIFRGMGR